MYRRAKWFAAAVFISIITAYGSVAALAQRSGPVQWQNDLTPIAPSDWNYDLAAHVLEAAGFGGTPEEIDALARLTPAEAVKRLVYFQSIENNLPAFEHSGIHDPGLEPFPESRPAVTKLAKEKGEALGIKVKRGGDRPIQPIVNKFFYWLRGSEGGLVEANMLADRDEDFNTRYGSFRGWQMAIERVKPIPRHAATIDLTTIIINARLKNTTEVVDYFIRRFMRVPPVEEKRKELIAFLNKQLGTSDAEVAKTFMEDPLRLFLHLLMSEPEFQLS